MNLQRVIKNTTKSHFLVKNWAKKMLTSATCDVIPRIVAKQKFLVVDYVHARFGRQGVFRSRYGRKGGGHTNPLAPVANR